MNSKIIIHQMIFRINQKRRLKKLKNQSIESEDYL